MTVKLSPDLERAITQLYRTFSRYDADQLSGCPHCVSDAENRHLATTPLKSLSPRDFENYARKAITTWGSIDEFKYFLPRLFDILARNGEEDFVIAEILLSKPGYGEWHKWMHNERAAVEDFFHALWLDLLSRHPHPLSADSCLCGLAGSIAGMTFYLDAWSSATQHPAMMHLADFVICNARGLAGTKPSLRLANAFWPDRPAQANQIWDWLRAPTRADQLERAFFAYGSEDKDGVLSQAFTYLDALRQRSASDS